jgi:hypothetical protein
VNPAEAARVLAVGATYDPRLNPPSREDSLARAQAWSLALDPDLAEADAVQLVIDHYRESTTAILPATVNLAWRRRKADQAERERSTRALTEQRSAAASAVPMPPEIRAAIHRIIHKTGVE